MNKCTDMIIKMYFYRNLFNKHSRYTDFFELKIYVMHESENSLSLLLDRIRNFRKTSVFFFVKVN